MDVIVFALQVIGLLAALLAVYTTVRAYMAPRSVLDWLARTHGKQGIGRQIAQMLLVMNFVGYAVLAIGGIDNALAWLPHSVANFGGWGELTSARTAISVILGIVAAYPIYSLVSRLAELQARANKGEGRR